MVDNRFWCPRCKRTLLQAEVAQREVDSTWGEGCWWYCPACGSNLTPLPEMSEMDEITLAQARQMLAQIRGSREIPPPAATIRLLFAIGESYRAHGRYLEACRAFSNASETAHQNTLPELEIVAVDMAQHLAGMFSLDSRLYQQKKSLQNLLEQFISYYRPDDSLVN